MMFITLVAMQQVVKVDVEIGIYTVDERFLHDIKQEAHSDRVLLATTAVVITKMRLQLERICLGTSTALCG